jgi:hypothetical protein
MGTFVQHSLNHDGTHHNNDGGTHNSSDLDGAVALAIDAHTLFVYWTVSDITQSLLAKHFTIPWTQMRLSLRTMDVTGVVEGVVDGDTPNQFNHAHMSRQPLNFSKVHGNRDEGIYHTTTQFYVKGLLSGRDYVVDIGTWAEGQHFFTIVRSNLVRTPYVHSQSHSQAHSHSQPHTRGFQTAPLTTNDWKATFTGYSLGG